MHLLPIILAFRIDAARVPVESGLRSVVAAGSAVSDTADSISMVESELRTLIDSGITMLRAKRLQQFLVRFLSPQEKVIVRTTLDDPVRRFWTSTDRLRAALNEIRDAAPEYSAATGIARFELIDGGVIEFARSAGVWYMHYAIE